MLLKRFSFLFLECFLPIFGWVCFLAKWIGMEMVSTLLSMEWHLLNCAYSLHIRICAHTHTHTRAHVLNVNTHQSKQLTKWFLFDFGILYVFHSHSTLSSLTSTCCCPVWFMRFFVDKWLCNCHWICFHLLCLLRANAKKIQIQRNFGFYW